MPENKSPVLSSHHYKLLKQRERSRQLVDTCVKLLEQEDHDALAYLARTLGIPPQLRHQVWPLLLKYHPMCISPNIMSNTVVWDAEEGLYKLVNGAETKPKDNLEGLILHDLRKYFRNVSESEQDRGIDVLKDAILRFLSKWSKLFQYESGLAWIAVGLAEWVPLAQGCDGPVVLGERKHSHTPMCGGSGSNGSSPLNCTCLSHLYREYPLPESLREALPSKPLLTFEEVYERLLLVILHCPDTVAAQRLVEAEYIQKSASRRKSVDVRESRLKYFPFISGGDLSYQTQVFFKVFSTVLPELYHPFTEENALQSSSKRTGWLYWWMKCSGARAFHKQDRGRLWDILLGWRPEPNANVIDFFLNYNLKKFDHLYSSKFKNDLAFLKTTTRNDPFWFPDLDTLPLGSGKFTYDFNVFEELLNRNRYGHETPPDPAPERYDNKIPFSLLDPHIQLVFVYISILQYNEFKLLEFEETETAEFLNNVPMLSKADDICFKRLYDHDSMVFQNGASSQEELPKRPDSSNLRMGSDAKASHSFDDILSMAGDIWRKWLWKELEECSVSE